MSRSAGPRLPSVKVSMDRRPTRSTATSTGPMLRPSPAETSAVTAPSPAWSPRYTLTTVTPANDAPTGISVSRPALPRSVRPWSLDHMMPPLKPACSPCAGMTAARKPSPSPGDTISASDLTFADSDRRCRASDSARLTSARTAPSSRRVLSLAPATRPSYSPISRVLVIPPDAPSNVTPPGPICRPSAAACRSTVGSQNPETRPQGSTISPGPPRSRGERASVTPYRSGRPKSGWR